MPKPTLLALSGSTRAESSNQRLLRYFAERFSDRFTLNLDFKLDKLPHFNPDLDKEPLPDTVLQLRQLIADADALLICTPEYVFSLPGVLKNALEWMVSTVVLTDKPCCFVVAAASGEKAYASLELILTTLQLKLSPETGLLISGGQAKVSPNGEIEDSALIDRLELSMTSLLTMCNEE